MVTETRKGPGAAYIPFKTLFTATDILAQGTPKRLDASVFPTFSGTMRSWTLTAFQFLGFTDKDGNVQPLLQQWINGEADDRKNIMETILRSRYSDVLALSAENGTPAQMRAEIEKLGVSGTTAHRAVRFFLDAAAFAGYTVPAAWKRMPATAGSSGGGRRKRRLATGGRTTVNEDDDDLEDLGVGGGTGYALPVLDHSLIRGLIEMMPIPDAEWDDAAQEQWISLAKSIFKMVYKQPIRQLGPAAVQTVAP